MKDLSPDERRRRRELWIIAVLALLLVGLTALEAHLPQIRHRLPVTDNALFFAIININVILMLLMIFLILRNVVKLVFERKRKVLGSKLRTKLVVAFVLLSLIPTVLLFSVAWFFITRSIEMWVHVQVEQALEGALKVAQHYYKSTSDNALYFAKQLGHAIEKERLLDPDRSEALRRFVQLKQLEYNLDRVSVFSPELAELASSRSAALQGKRVPAWDAAAVRQMRSGKDSSRVRPMDEGELLEAIVPIGEPEHSGTIRGFLAVGCFVAESLVNKMAEISRSLDRHRETILYKQPFKSGMLIVLIMVTLLIVFAATWFGFFLAKEITTPIQHLASGIEHVARGDLAHRIEESADDEMGILVDSFNRMTADLMSKSRAIEQAQDELRSTNVELEQRRRYMEIVLRNVGAGVVSLDKEGVVQTINTFAANLFAVDARDVVGKRYAEFLSAEHIRLLTEMVRDMNERGLKGLERQIEVVLKGEPKSLRVHLSVLEDETGGFLGLVGVFEDHTELIRAQRAAAWREVARRIAHEIKNPLTPIQLSAQRLRKRYLGTLGEDGRVFEECTGTIIRQVEEMKNLVNEFSNFARMPAVRLRPESLNRIVKETLVLYREAHRSVEFDFEEDASLPPVPLDEQQIRRLLINLLDNALAAVGERGTVQTRTRFDRTLNMAVIELADDGPGIPPEVRGRLFEPYTSTKRGGTGLGLAIVKTIVADHKGYIKVRDNYPTGTRFIIELPV